MENKLRLKGNTQKRIIEAAAAEFAGSGLAGARIDSIAELAGVNKAMIYYHFASKEKLYQTIIDEQVDKVSMALQGVVGSDMDLETVLLTLAKTYHAAFGGRQDLVAMLLHELADGGVHLKQALQNMIWGKGIPDRLKSLLEDGIREGRFRTIDPRQALLSFAGMNLFYLFMSSIATSLWEVEHENEFLENRPGQIVDLFLHGILSRQG
jgi:TetR/AcrR family transcriptional regulator